MIDHTQDNQKLSGKDFQEKAIGIATQYKKNRRFRKLRNTYGIGSITKKRIKEAYKLNTSILQESETLLCLGYEESGCHYLITDKAIYSERRKKKPMHWTDIEYIYIKGYWIYLNDIPFIRSGYPIKDVIFEMFYQIFTSTVGFTFTFSLDKVMKFPQQCIGCYGSADKALKLKALGELQDSFLTRIVSSATLFMIRDFERWRKTLIKYKIPICSDCRSKLKRCERNPDDCILESYPNKDAMPRPIIGNRHITIRLGAFKSNTPPQVKMWIRNKKFYDEICRLNEDVANIYV